MKLMKVLAFIIAVLMILLGIIGLVTPNRLLSIAQYTTTTGGLYAVAAIRVGIGIILLAAASGSRFPMILRVLGALAIIGGVATLFLGVDRARTIANWAMAQGTTVIRGFAVFAVAIGSFIAYAVNKKSAS